MGDDIGDEGFEDVIEAFEAAFKDFGLDYDRQRTSTSDGEEEHTTVVFKFVETNETEYYLGLRSDQRYGDFIWDYDLLPDFQAKLDNQQAGDIIPEAELPTEPSEELTSTEKQFVSLLQSAREDELEEKVSDTPLEENLEEEGKEDFLQNIQENFHKLYAARVALDRLDHKQIRDIRLQLERIFKSHPFSFDIQTTANGGFQGFKIRYKVFPYDQFPEQKLWNAYKITWNHGLYAERFLKSTFNLTEDELEWGDSVDQASKSSDFTLLD